MGMKQIEILVYSFIQEIVTKLILGNKDCSRTYFRICLPELFYESHIIYWKWLVQLTIYSMCSVTGSCYCYFISFVCSPFRKYFVYPFLNLFLNVCTYCSSFYSLVFCLFISPFGSYLFFGMVSRRATVITSSATAYRPLGTGRQSTVGEWIFILSHLQPSPVCRGFLSSVLFFYVV